MSQSGPNRSPTATGLRRELGLFALVVFGVGDILGAGIYVLIGEIAAIAGTASWLAFVLALGVASLTALTYAELGSRYPHSGGESFYCQQAFGSASLSLLVGLLVVCSGIVSLATVSRAFAGFLIQLLVAPPSGSLEAILLTLVLVLLGGINFWGIRQSSKANIVCTAIEASGLLLVIVVGVAWLVGREPGPAVAIAGARADWPAWTAVGQAAALAFFAFIGFEDMVNVAEEVKSPRRSLPVAIIAALLTAGGIYLAVAAIATAVVSPEELSRSKAPLLLVVQRAAPSFPAGIFIAIALFAIANTGLLNFIMASRLLYGMADQRLVPDWFRRVHPRTHTPHWSIAVVFASALALALSGTVRYLAGTTSMLLLVVFFSINAALVWIKSRAVQPPTGFNIPIGIPILGCVASVALVGFAPPESLFAGAVLIVLAVATVCLRPRDQ